MLRRWCLVGFGFGLVLAEGCGTSDAAGPTAVGGAPAAVGGAMVGVSAGTPGSTGGAGSAGGPAASGAGGANAAGAGGQLGVAGASGASSSAGASGSTSMPLFSDDFEAASIASKWTPRINGGSMFELDTTQFHGGKQSLHLKHNGFSSLLAAEAAPIFPAPNNTFYARLWLRVAAPLPQGHVVWFEAGDVTNDTHEVRVGMNIGKFQSNLFYQGEVDIRDPDAKITADTWHCVLVKYGPDVLDVSLDGTHSSISTTTWVAADQANGSTGTPKTGWSPTYAAFRIGWELGSGEVWYDDVALDHAPLACN